MCELFFSFVGKYVCETEYNRCGQTTSMLYCIGMYYDVMLLSKWDKAGFVNKV